MCVEDVLVVPILTLYADKRVHWLRARAQSKRWGEELTFINYEMQWTVKYFQYKSRWWKDSIRLASDADSPLSGGQAAYAERQSAFWGTLMMRADTSFAGTNCNYVRL